MCRECRGELLHNPVLLVEDVNDLAKLVKRGRLDEEEKPEGRVQIAGRIELFHEVIRKGLEALLDES